MAISSYQISVVTGTLTEHQVERDAERPEANPNLACYGIAQGLVHLLAAPQPKPSSSISTDQKSPDKPVHRIPAGPGVQCPDNEASSGCMFDLVQHRSADERISQEAIEADHAVKRGEVQQL